MTLRHHILTHMDKQPRNEPDCSTAPPNTAARAKKEQHRTATNNRPPRSACSITQLRKTLLSTHSAHSVADTISFPFTLHIELSSTSSSAASSLSFFFLRSPCLALPVVTAMTDTAVNPMRTRSFEQYSKKPTR